MSGPERVELANAWGRPHSTTVGYFGGPLDGRSVRLEQLSGIEAFDRAIRGTGTQYSVTRYGVHYEDGSVCWALLTYDPIIERGKL